MIFEKNEIRLGKTLKINKNDSHFNVDAVRQINSAIAHENDQGVVYNLSIASVVYLCCCNQ